MNFNNVIKARYSIRKFLDRDVPDQLIAKILELAKLAPSAGNLQSYKIIIVKDKEVKVEGSSKKLLHTVNC